jgi:hypothetical protein
MRVANIDVRFAGKLVKVRHPGAGRSVGLARPPGGVATGLIDDAGDVV